MSKNYLSWASAQSLPSINAEASKIKLLTTNTDEKAHIENFQDSEANSYMHTDNDTSLTPANEKITEDIPFVEKLESKKPYHHIQSTQKKCVGKKFKVLTASKYKITKSKSVDQVQPLTVVSSTVSNKKDDIVNPNQVSQTIDQENKTSKGNIPLKTIENKLVSQRSASIKETQVASCSSMICSECIPTSISTCCVPASEQICYQEECCIPSTISCDSSTYVIEQCEPVVCCPPQEQQILVCNEPTPSQTYICSPSSNNCVQQKYICVDNRPKLSLCQPVATTSCNQSYLCVPQTPVQRNANIIIQQAQQPPTIQIIQNPQPPTAQCFQIGTPAPQLIQTVNVPVTQIVQPPPTIQITMPTASATPQILLQRPYDGGVVPVQNQQFVVTPTAPMASPIPPKPQPVMFRTALNRAFAKQVGLPLPMQYQAPVPAIQQPINRPTAVMPPLPPTSPVIPTGGCVQASSPLPIAPLSPGGLLIPFQPSKDMKRGGIARTNPSHSNLRNFDDIRRQIQHRAELLDKLQKRINEEQASSPLQRSRTTAGPSLPTFSPNTPSSSNPYRSTFPQSSIPYSSNPTRPPSAYQVNPSAQPTTNRPQTPFSSGNIFGSSSSSNSSRSSASSTAARPSNRASSTSGFYAQPSFNGSRGESLIPGPSGVYHSLQP